MSAKITKITPPHTFLLKHPIARAVTGKESSAITAVEILRRPRLKDMRAVGQHADKLAQNAKAIACITDLPPQAIDELDLDDFQGLIELVGPLFSPTEDSSGASAGAPATQ